MNEVLSDHTGSADQHHHSCSGSKPRHRSSDLPPSVQGGERERDGAAEDEVQADLLQLVKTA